MRISFLSGQQQPVQEVYCLIPAGLTPQVTWDCPKKEQAAKPGGKGHGPNYWMAVGLCWAPWGGRTPQCPAGKAGRLLGLLTLSLLQWATMKTSFRFGVFFCFQWNRNTVYTVVVFVICTFFSCNCSNVTSLPLLWAQRHPSNAHSKFVMKCLLTGMAACSPQL